VQAFVENGLAGCRLAVERQTVTIVVDALRASANIVSLFHYGTEELLVVEEVEQAFSERERRPGAILVGERGGPMVPGFDLGNSPLRQPPAIDIRRIVFSSSNCSRCCVGASEAPMTLLATTVNATAAAREALAAAERLGTEELVFITAGAAVEETRLTIEDHLAVRAIMAACEKLGAPMVCGNDRARVCCALCKEVSQEALTRGFGESDNGSRLARIGLGADVEFASRLDVFDVVPRVVATAELADGGRGAMVAKG